MGILNQLQQWAEKVGRETLPVDPVVFGDPIAQKTQWTPLKPGGASFRTHRLEPVEPDGMQMKKTLGMVAFALVFLLVGLGVAIAGVVSQQWYIGLFGGVFLFFGALMAWPRRILFDGSMRQFSAAGRTVPFSTIHAIQLIKERVRGDKTTYWSYELNLVLNDGERVHVVDHGDLPGLQNDAQRLQVLLGCKLWDGTATGEQGQP